MQQVADELIIAHRPAGDQQHSRLAVDDFDADFVLHRFRQPARRFSSSDARGCETAAGPASVGDVIEGYADRHAVFEQLFFAALNDGWLAFILFELGQPARSTSGWRARPWPVMNAVIVKPSLMCTCVGAWISASCSVTGFFVLPTPDRNQPHFVGHGRLGCRQRIDARVVPTVGQNDDSRKGFAGLFANDSQQRFAQSRFDPARTAAFRPNRPVWR